MEQQKFKGVIYLSKEQYDELKANGTIEIEGVTLTYEPYTTIYVTPDDDKVNQSDLAQTSSTLQTQIDALKTTKKYLHTVSSNSANNYGTSAIAFSFVNDVSEPYTQSTWSNKILYDLGYIYTSSDDANDTWLPCAACIINHNDHDDNTIIAGIAVEHKNNSYTLYGKGTKQQNSTSTITIDGEECTLITNVKNNPIKQSFRLCHHDVSFHDIVTEI